MDNLLPKPGEELLFIGNRFNLITDKYYKVVRRSYNIVCAYEICIVDEFGIETWVPLVEFSLIEG